MEVLDYSAEDLRIEAQQRASKISIQGVQPKLSARLNVKKSSFTIVDNKGTYILKPQHYIYKQMPENEDLTMSLAATIDIDVPEHGLVMSKDGSYTYYIKRFDRRGTKSKLSVEDFAQLSGSTRDTKYDYTIEKMIKIVDEECTFPLIEKVKFFKLLFFNYLIGNEDAHLKNYSLISDKNIVKFTPAYDLINSTIIIGSDAEESALSIKGKKSNLTKKVMLEYLPLERMGLNNVVVNNVISQIKSKIVVWKELINTSYLSDDLKEKYLNLLEDRLGKMRME